MGCAKSPQLAESVPLATPLARFGKSVWTASKQTVKKLLTRAPDESACLVSRCADDFAKFYKTACLQDMCDTAALPLIGDWYGRKRKADAISRSSVSNIAGFPANAV